MKRLGIHLNSVNSKDISVKMNLKEGAQIKQQEGRPIPIHLQEQMAKELKRLIENGYLERATEISENCFVSPAVITVKKDKSIKKALDSRKLNEVTIKRKAQMPNMEEQISIISRKISGEDGEILATKLDFDYAYDKLNGTKSKKSMYIYRYGWKFHWLLPLLERILWSGRCPNNNPRTDR